MALDTPRDKIIFGVGIPILASIIGALAATWFGASSVDHAQLQDIMGLIRDASLSGDQKLHALEIYKEITDRPWSIARSLMSISALMAGALGVAWAIRIQNKR